MSTHYLITTFTIVINISFTIYCITATIYLYLIFFILNKSFLSLIFIGRVTEAIVRVLCEGSFTPLCSAHCSGFELTWQGSHWAWSIPLRQVKE